MGRAFASDRQVLSTMRAHQMFLKMSKCSFGETSVAYVGHVVLPKGSPWMSARSSPSPTGHAPRSVHALRGFLGLAGYYRRFIQDFGKLAAPLTSLLKRDAFQWSPAAETIFLALKRSLTSAPVLDLPDFTRPFIIECDASGSGIRAVLHQADGAIAFFSRALPPKHCGLAAYER
jgi:hypothetical protein